MDEVRRQMAARYAAAKTEEKPKLRICDDCQRPVYDSKVCPETGLYHDREKMRIVGGQVTEVDTRVFSGRDLISAIDAARVKWQAARTRKVRIDATAVTIFQTFVLQHQWRLQRCGILYGDYDAVSGTITAHCIYEPEQEGDDMFFKLLPDSREKRVDAIAHALGLRRVGIILTHPPRDAEEIVLTAGELLLLAREQSRFGDECVLLTVAPDPATHQIAAQAWQASEQCVRLFRMGVLSRDEHPGMVRSAIPLELAQDVRDEKGHQKCVVRQPSATIDARWMTAYCAVESFDSAVTQNKFVRISRPGEAPPDFPNLRAYLSDPKRNRLPFWQQVNDFHVLIFLAEKLLQRDADVSALVTAVKNGDAAGAAKFEEMVKTRLKA